jgi:acetyl-CoA synthetase
MISENTIDAAVAPAVVAIPPPESFTAQAAISGMAAYCALCAQAEADYEGFWAERAREQLSWSKPFSTVLNERDAPFFTWFEDGELNASYNPASTATSRTAKGTRSRSASRPTTVPSRRHLPELLAKVCRWRQGSAIAGRDQGDRVVIYMAMSIEGIVAMQACARIGATHSVVFGGFSAKALHERVVDVGAVAIITADEQMRGGKALPLKQIVDAALELGDCAPVKHVVVHRRTGGQVAWNSARDRWMSVLCADQPDTCAPVAVGAEHPLFILYTSGSTGKPKGVQHSTGGYLLWAAQTMRWTFDIRDDDVFWCTADIGWVTGHTYIAYGPLAVGATQVVFEGVPTYPDAGRFWDMIEAHRVSIFYTAPTAIRSLVKAADADPAVRPGARDLSSLRLLGSVGEPINPETWKWFHEHVGTNRCPIVDTFWQTETGGHMITPLPGATPLVPGSCTLPLPGILAAIVDETGNDVPNGRGGLLVVKRPWPSMVRTIHGDPQRFRSSYFPEELGGNLYLAGDGAIRDESSGYFTIMGRIDDVLNVSGHRMGTMEIESALVANPLVAEAAVVGRPDDTTGEAIAAFVVLKQARPTGDEAKRIATELRAWVGKEIGPIAKPKEIRFGDNLPKTRSGKIMRRLLRSLAKGEAITQDISTLENPAILEQLAQPS